MYMPRLKSFIGTLQCILSILLILLPDILLLHTIVLSERTIEIDEKLRMSGYKNSHVEKNKGRNSSDCKQQEKKTIGCLGITSPLLYCMWLNSLSLGICKGNVRQEINLMNHSDTECRV